MIDGIIAFIVIAVLVLIAIAERWLPRRLEPYYQRRPAVPLPSGRPWYEFFAKYLIEVPVDSAALTSIDPLAQFSRKRFSLVDQTPNEVVFSRKNAFFRVGARTLAATVVVQLPIAATTKVVVRFRKLMIFELGGTLYSVANDLRLRLRRQTDEPLRLIVEESLDNPYRSPEA